MRLSVLAALGFTAFLGIMFYNIVPRGTMETAPSDVPVSPNRDPLLIDLALQGGGAHGA